MASLYSFRPRVITPAMSNAWEARPKYQQWYYLVRVWLIMNRARIPVLIALVLLAAGIATYALGQSALYGLLMMALGAALVLIILWTRPRC